MIATARTSPTATLLGEVMNAVGVPRGVYNVVHGLGPGSAGEFLTSHPGVNAITFTGETRTGEAIMGGMNPQHMIVSGLGATPTDSVGYPWTSRYTIASGNLLADFRFNVTAESQGRLQVCRLYELTEDAGVRAHRQAFADRAAGDLGAHRDERDLATVGLDQPQRGLDGVLVTRIEGAVDALTHQQVVLAERRGALGLGHVLHEHDDLHGSVLPPSGLPRGYLRPRARTPPAGLLPAFVR